MKDTIIVVVLIGLTIGCFILYRKSIHDGDLVKQQSQQHDQRLLQLEYEADRSNRIFEGLLETLPGEEEVADK